MLNFILGTSGTGKTTKIISDIGRLIEKEEKVVLLVPEQFSFESERRIYKEFGAKSSLYVEVLSFTRLCNNIFREFGGLSGISVTEAAKYILMSVTLNELQDQLKIYRKSAQNISFLDTLLLALGEFKTAGINQLSLETLTENIENKKLKEKLEDLSLVYTAYQALLEKGFSDPEDDIIRACEILENNNFFSSFHIFVDGFTTFMSGEFELLSHIISSSKSVTIALTTDTLSDDTEGTGVFSTQHKVITRLKKMAEKAGAPVSPPYYLEEPVRYKSDELKILSKNFLQNRDYKYEGKTQDIAAYIAQDGYHEVQFVAAKIKELVREKGFRYSDIAVVTRDISGYIRTFELLFLKYDIPFFYDKRIDIEVSPLAFGLLTALNSIITNFDSETVLFLAKSPIMGLDIEAVSHLENYCYSWQVRGQLWQSDFTNNPRGMVEEFKDSDIESLKSINITRARITAPLIKLKQAVTGGNARSFAVGIYSFLEEVNAAQNLKDYAAPLREDERDELLAVSSSLWDGIMDILDVFGEVIGDINLSYQRLIELFKMAVSSADIGVIPQTLDQVLIGEADRIRPSQKKAVFVIGVNEESFPATISDGGVFSDNERRTLADIGIEISRSAFQQALLERFFGYFAFTLPSDYLFVSWIISDLKGKEMLPSIFISQLEAVFSNISYTVVDHKDLVQSSSSAISVLGDVFGDDTELRATLLSYTKKTAPEILSGMEMASIKVPYQLNNEKIADDLFGRSLYLSPTKVERFHKCPFAYFVQDGLRIKKRSRVEFSPLESGSLIHHVLQVMLQKYGGKGLSLIPQAQMEEEVRGIISEYLENHVEDLDTVSTRFTHLFGRLCGTITRLLKHLGKEFAQSLYTPVEFELEINRKNGVKPLELKTPDGRSVVVEGIVDRVDVMEENGQKYIRVVDYKSGSKSFKLHDVLYGLNLQMLLYLFTVSQNGTGELEGGIPAGVLYMPVRESYLSVERNTDSEKAGEELEKQWKMSGILLDDEDALRGMEEDLAGVFIPAKVTKSGKLDARSSLANNAEMGKLSQKIKHEILRMAEELGAGKIPAFPINTNDYPTCSYCDYRDICGYEDGDPIRTIDKIDDKKVMELLEKEDENA